MIGDNRYLIIRRLLKNAGGSPLPGDLESDLLEKYLILIGGTPLPGDDFNVLLRKIVIIKGGTPTPGDNEWNLLVKWLQAKGECRACGDMIIDLWRKILDSEVGEVEPPLPNGLLAGLTGYWKLDELSGIRFDSHGSYDLSEVGSVGSTAGALNNAAEFFASELDFLSNASPDLGTHSGSFSFSTWVKMVNLGEGVIFGKGGPALGGGWSLRLGAGPAFALASYDGDFNEERCVSSEIASTGIFYHVAASFDVTSGNASIWVNGVRTDDGHLASVDPVAAFIMSVETTSVVDELAIWIGRTLSDADVVVLLNGGVPLPFSSFTI